MDWRVEKFLNDMGDKAVSAGSKGLREMAKAGRIGKEKVEDGISHLKESQWMAKETKQIVQETQKKQQDAEIRLEVAQEELSRAWEDWLKQYESIRKEQLARFLRLYNYSFAFNEFHRQWQLLQQVDQMQSVPDGQSFDFEGSSAASSAWAGAAAGVAAAGTAIGLTVALGTASTGAAISGLTGSALLSATLASLGGGSLAAGGAGIVGGMAVLGGLLAVPAVAVGVYHWDSSVHKNYQNALAFQQEVETRTLVLQAHRGLCLQLTRSLQAARFEMSATEAFLDQMLDVFEQDMLLGKADVSRKLATEVFTIVKNLLEIRFIEEDHIHPRLDDRLQQLHQQFHQCQRSCGKYLSGLNQQYREAVEELFQQKKSDWVIRPLEDRAIREQFEKAFAEAQKEICILSPWIEDWMIDDPQNRFRDQQLIQAVRDALQRGVKVSIRYGMGDGEYSGKTTGESGFRDQKTLRNAVRLKQQYAAYGSLFQMKQGSSHGKLLICDDRYYVIGSFNFLSFKGTYKGKTQRGEIADYSENKDMIAWYRKRFFSF